MSWTSGCEIIIVILYTVKYQGVLLPCGMTFPKQLLHHFLCQLGNFLLNIIYRFCFFCVFLNKKAISFISPSP